MKEIKTGEKPSNEIAALYPELTEEQRQEAEFYLTQYVEIVRGIFERVRVKEGEVDKISESSTMSMT
jgi:response regulator RpfG family c-di-GMP phosphodiesterase